MDQFKSTEAEQIARAAAAFERQRTGLVPSLVSVVQSDGVLEITLRNVFSPLDRTLIGHPDGVAHMQALHRDLFANSSDWLQGEIRRITDRPVYSATAEVEAATGTVVAMFKTGAACEPWETSPAENRLGSPARPPAQVGDEPTGAL